MRNRWARLLVAAGAAFALPILAARPELTAPKGAEGPSLLILSIRGLSPNLIREADRLGLRIPNLRQLVADGASAETVSGALPTVTDPSHATLVTGNARGAARP